MNLKQAIEFGIQLGMKTFTVQHYSSTIKSAEIPADKIFQYIEGYEDCIIMTCYYGTAYSHSIPSQHYQRPDYCYFIYRLPNEEIPTEPKEK